MNATKQTNYRVCLSDRIENTGLDFAVFATQSEAEIAADMVRKQYGATEHECSVGETTKNVTTTFAAWNAKGW